MFNHDVYNETLTKRRTYKCTSVCNKSDKLFDSLILQYIFDNDVILEFLVVSEK